MMVSPKKKIDEDPFASTVPAKIVMNKQSLGGSCRAAPDAGAPIRRAAGWPRTKPVRRPD
jgi:hypothetical protein